MARPRIAENSVRIMVRVPDWAVTVMGKDRSAYCREAVVEKILRDAGEEEGKESVETRRNS